MKLKEIEKDLKETKNIINKLKNLNNNEIEKLFKTKKEKNNKTIKKLNELKRKYYNEIYLKEYKYNYKKDYEFNYNKLLRQYKKLNELLQYKYKKENKEINKNDILLIKEMILYKN